MRKNYKRRIARKSFLITLFITVFNYINVLGQTPSPQEYEMIIERLIEDQRSDVNISTVDNNIDSKKSIIVNGAFSDIDYTKTDRTNWAPADHLLRLRNYATAYVTPTSAYYQSVELYNILVDGLEYWLKTKPTSNNWWYNQVDTGQKMGMLLVLMENGASKFSQDLITRSTDYMKQYCGNPANWQAANRLDIAKHWMYRGVVLRDNGLTSTAVNYIFEPTKIDSSGDGIQKDYSYATHGNQLYIGAYGDIYVDGTIENALVFKGTVYELSSDKINILHDFIEQSYLPTMRGNYRLYSVIGRSLTRKSTAKLDVWMPVVERLENMKQINPSKTTFYQDAIDRMKQSKPSYKIEPKHTHFWRTDYTLHQRSGYTIDTRIISNRTTRSETLNNENLKGYFLSDGAMAITVDGGEYSNVVSAWDWSKIPGTTTPAYPLANIPYLYSIENKTTGSTSFAGGVSDGYYGATGLIYNDKYSNINTSARKGWFYFDDEVVCLGAGISSSNQYDITTTINQTIKGNGNINIFANGSQSVVGTGIIKTFSNPEWIHQSKTAYFFPFPNQTNLSVNCEYKKSNWNVMNSTNASEVSAAWIFSTWINHGNKPTNGSYAYIIVPNVKLSEVSNYDQTQIEILENTSGVQAVKHKGLNLLQIIFYESGTFTNADNSISITVNRPCAIMLKNVGKENVDLFVADPTQSASNIDIVAKLPSLGSKIIRIENLSIFPIDKNNAGVTNKILINKNTEDYDNNYVEVAEFPVQDTYVVSLSGNENTIFGLTDPEQLIVKYNYDREAYLAFKVDQFEQNKPQNSQIKKYELVLTVKYANEEAYMVPLLCKQSNTNWSESTMTWNNRATVYPVLLSTASVSSTNTAGSKIMFDVTSAVQNAILSGDNDISFNISQNLSGSSQKHDVSFYSKDISDNTKKPILRALAYDESGSSIEDEIKIGDSLLIYPNVVNKGDYIYIKAQDVFFKTTWNSTITDLSGRVHLNSIGDKIDTSTLSSGIYLLSITSPTFNNNVTTKIIVK